MQTTEESGGRALLSPKVGRGPRAEFPPAKEIWQGLRFVFREEKRVDLYLFSAPPVLLIESESVKRTAVLSSENRPGWSQNKGSCTIYGDSTLHWQSYFTFSDSYKNPCVLSRQVKCCFPILRSRRLRNFCQGSCLEVQYSFHSNNTQCLHRIFFGIITIADIIMNTFYVPHTGLHWFFKLALHHFSFTKGLYMFSRNHNYWVHVLHLLKSTRHAPSLEATLNIPAPRRRISELCLWAPGLYPVYFVHLSARCPKVITSSL